MNILIAGVDGYLDYLLAIHLSSRGHEVHGVDNFSHRNHVSEVGGQSATPIKTIRQRM
jgi:nucleoside-diphosphate-sugar epimerase